MKKRKIIIKGINKSLLKKYFCDNGNDNPFDDLLPDVNGFDLTVNSAINSVLTNYNQTKNGSFVTAEYIFFTYEGKKYGTFLYIHNVKEEKALVKMLTKDFKLKDVCIKYGTI